jgi:hypothetical protein
MSTVHFFDLYSLHYSAADQVRAKLPEASSSFTKEVKQAFNGLRIKERKKEDEPKLNMIKMMVLPNFEEGNPGLKMCQKMVENGERAIASMENVLSTYSGCDPYAIQKIVHQLLGFSGENVPEKAAYLKILQETGFLTLKQEASSLSYRPERLAAGLFQSRPEVKALYIGCGEAGKTYVGSCYFRRAEDHAKASFSMDLAPDTGADLSVDMHNQEFWQAIPDERFEEISDHTYGHFLFEDKNSESTLRQMHRVLKPGGRLAMDHDFSDDEQKILKETGFIVESPKIARKSD